MLSQIKTWKEEVRKLIDKKVVVDGEKVALNNDHYRELANLNLDLVPYESCFLKKKDTEGKDIVDENKPDSKCDLYKQINSYRTAQAKVNKNFSINICVTNKQSKQSKDELISQLRLELQQIKKTNHELSIRMTFYRNRLKDCGEIVSESESDEE